MRTISAFSHHRVRRRSAAPTRTARFARDRSLVVEQIVELLVEIRRRNNHIETPARESAKWIDEVDDLCHQLIGTIPPVLRVLRAVSWYAEQPIGFGGVGILRTGKPNWKDNKIPRVDSGKALREKFTRLEDAMLEWISRRGPSVSETMSGLFNGSRVAAEAFRSGALAEARRLDLGGATEAEVATALVSLYHDIRTRRSNGLGPGPLDLLRRYISWLGEKRGWTMSLRVLSADSPAFAQFRRKEAALHPRGADPLTGR